MKMLFDDSNEELTRVAMWHEAGHAIVARHMGARVMYYGLEPIPHCLVVPWGLTRHQRGVLLCAGGAMTRAVFGHEWGTGTDYQMAAALGDLELFKREAYEQVLNLLPQAKLLADGRLGALCQTGQTANAEAGVGLRWIEDLSTHHPDHLGLTRLVEKAGMGKFMHWLIVKLAEVQIKHPQLAARLSRI